MKDDATSTIPCPPSSLLLLPVPCHGLTLSQVSGLGSDLKHARLEEVTGETTVLLQIAVSFLAWFLAHAMSALRLRLQRKPLHAG